VTGTEVLTGIISDRNGPWLSERLREVGVDAAMIHVVGDRPEDLLASLEYMRREGMAVVITSGGLGPTADDLTAEIVGRFCGREMVLDDELEAKIAEILRPLLRRWPGLDQDALRESNRKQAVIPKGATILDPVGTAPGLVVPPVQPGGGPTVVVLPGPPRELQPMWRTAIQTDAFREAIAGATTYVNGVLRLFGIPESEIASTLRAAEAAGLELEPLEITTWPAPRRDRGVDSLRAAGRGRVREARAVHPGAPQRHAVLRGRLDGRRAGDHAARGPAPSRSPNRARAA